MTLYDLSLSDCHEFAAKIKCIEIICRTHLLRRCDMGVQNWGVYRIPQIQWQISNHPFLNIKILCIYIYWNLLLLYICYILLYSIYQILSTILERPQMGHVPFSDAASAKAAKLS